MIYPNAQPRPTKFDIILEPRLGCKAIGCLFVLPPSYCPLKIGWNKPSFPFADANLYNMV